MPAPYSSAPGPKPMSEPNGPPLSPNQGGPESIDSNQGGPESSGPNEGGPESSGAVPQSARDVTAKRLNGAGAAILILEALAVLFVPRAIAQTGAGLTPWRLSTVLAVAVLLVVVAGLQRRIWGPQVGLAVQLPVLATGFFTGAMWFLGALFVLLWVYLLRIRAEQLGSPHASPPNEDG